MRRLAAATLLWCALASSSVLAQSNETLPDWQGRRFPAPGVSPVPDNRAQFLPPLPPPTPNAALAGGGEMYVREIEVRGITVFSHAVVAKIVAAYEKRVVSSAELQTLRIELTHLYVDKGFINSGVLLPEQDFKDGLVFFQAVEGRLSEVRVESRTPLSSGYIISRIRAWVKDPLNVSDLQYSLRYLQDDPNISRLDARLGPGDESGESVLRLSVEEAPRFMATLAGDNYQSSSIGADEGKVLLAARDLSGFGDQLKVSVGRSSGNTLGSALFSLPVSPHNALVQAYYSRGSAVIIEQPFELLNIKENVSIYGVSLTVPVLDGLLNRVALFAGGEAARSSTELLGTGFSFSPGAQNGVSRVTMALAGVDWLHRGSTRVTDLRLTYRRGVPALGAIIHSTATQDQTLNPNPTGADGRFGLEQLQFIDIERLNELALLSQLNDRAQLLLRLSGQLSQDPLLSLEKFTVGGVDTVRGFPANSFVRDNGASASIEVQWPIPGYRSQPDLRNLVLASFIDYGRSWDKVNQNPGAGFGDTTLARQMAGAGLGLSWNPLAALDTQIYWGRGVANNFGKDDPRLFVPHDLQYHGLYYAINLTARW